MTIVKHGPHHVRVYMSYFDYGEQDFMPCEACETPLVDVHHIHGRLGKDRDNIKNLIGLCRKHHERAHFSRNHVTPGEFEYIHNYFLTGRRKTFLK